MYRTKKRPGKRSLRIIRLYLFTLTLILTLSLMALLAQTAFAKTYVITDGDRVVTYTSFATDPAEVLGQAGVSLNEYDTYTTEAVEGTQTISIRRAQEVTIHYHGEVMRTTTLGETAGELLQRLNLDVSGEDVTSHGLDTQTFDGMVLRIDRIVTLQETYTSTIAHQVYYCNDPSVPEGSQDILTPGEDGEMLCTAGVTYVNGEESERTVLTQTVTKMPTTEVIGIGTGVQTEEAEAGGAPVIGDGYICLPTGEVLTYTHTDTVRATAYTHTDVGCDFITATGTTVHRGTVAVDPRYIPYGTRMFIMASDGSYIYGIATAEDCGGDIKGDRMDLYLPTFDECIEFGRRRCTLYFLG